MISGGYKEGVSLEATQSPFFGWKTCRSQQFFSFLANLLGQEKGPLQAMSNNVTKAYLLIVVHSRLGNFYYCCVAEIMRKLIERKNAEVHVVSLWLEHLSLDQALWV